MKNPMRAAGRALAIAALIAAPRTTQAAIRARFAEGSALWLKGESTLHAYASSATVLGLSFSCDAPPPLDAAVRSGAPVRMLLTIPVSGLKSGERGLDKNLRRALKADRHPLISFALKGYRVVHGTDLVLQGALEVAGASKPETLTVPLETEDGRLVVDGELPLLMTDFGIKPPTFMLGRLKTSDRVVIEFHLILEPLSG